MLSYLWSFAASIFFFSGSPCPHPSLYSRVSKSLQPRNGNETFAISFLEKCIGLSTVVDEFDLCSSVSSGYKILEATTSGIY